MGQVERSDRLPEARWKQAGSCRTCGVIVSELPKATVVYPLRSSSLWLNGLPGRLTGSNSMNLALTPLISLIAGILILIMPRLLNYIVAIYLIVIGLVGIFGGGLNLRI
jgi:hypothetical protein